MLVFGWLTITDVWELLQCRERFIIILCSHDDIIWACVRPDLVNDSLQENVEIELLFVAAQSDVKL